MNGTGSEFPYCRHVTPGAVSFMDFEAVARIFFGKFFHISVPFYLGDDRGDFDGGYLFVCLDYGLGVKTTLILYMQSPVEKNPKHSHILKNVRML